MPVWLANILKGAAATVGLGAIFAWFGVYDGGEMTTADVNPDNLYTNAFVPEFNKFDAQKVVNSVKGAK